MSFLQPSENLFVGEASINDSAYWFMMKEMYILNFRKSSNETSSITNQQNLKGNAFEQ